MSTTRYVIKRHYRDNARLDGTNVTTFDTLEEAQRHCNDPETASETCTTEEGKDRTKTYGPWFDAYYSYEVSA